MFPRDRVIASLRKYAIAFEEYATDEQLRGLLADFYAKRTLTHQAIDPKDCAESYSVSLRARGRAVHPAI